MVAWRFLLLAGPAAVAGAQNIRVRTLTPAVSTDSGVISNVYVNRVLSDGRILVNDAVQHRLVLFDSTLKHFTVLADTSGHAPYFFGTTLGGLLPFPGDSTAFVDATSRALVVIDPSGKMGRVTTPPKASDMTYLVGPTYGVPGFDANGRLYYRGVLTWAFPPIDMDGSRHDTTYVMPVDSAPIIRANLETRRLDTVATMRVPLLRRRLWHAQGRVGGMKSLVNPMPVTDDWAYFSDGTVAILRAQDYHIDWIMPDGSRKSTPKMPFDWRRVTDEEKHHIVDSLQKQLDSSFQAGEERLKAANSSEHLSPNAHGEVFAADVLPAFYPPTSPGTQMRVDRNGNLWILPSTSRVASGGLLYDVVNHSGEIIERVQLPAGRVIGGFGPNDSVYMIVPAALGWSRVERARIIR